MDGDAVKRPSCVCDADPDSASGRVALAFARQGSHRPGRAHISASGSSAGRFDIRNGPRGYPIKLRGHAWEPRCVQHVSLDRVCRPTLRFPPLAPAGGGSPASWVLSRRYDFLPPLPPHFVTFVWRYQRSLVVFAPQRTSAPPRPGVRDPVSPAGSSLRKRQELASSWGISIVHSLVFSRRRQDC